MRASVDRVRRPLAGASLVLLLAGSGGCGKAPYATQPPIVREPVAGTPFDRVLQRARINEPAEDLGGANSHDTEDGLHADWRVNGGPAVVGDDWAYVQDLQPKPADVADYVFSTVLVDGASHLELGRCDAVDQCGWTALDLVVKLGPGSPDPAFGVGGQRVVPSVPWVNTAAVLPDGRLLVGYSHSGGDGAKVTGLVALTSAGALDPKFGKKGVVLMPQPDFFVPRVSARAGGGYALLLFGGGAVRFGRLGADGALDAAFGQAGLVTLTLPGGHAFTAVAAFGSDGADGYVVAGEGNEPGQPSRSGPLLASIGPDGTVRAAALLGSGIEGGNVLDAQVGGDGRALILLVDRVLAGSAGAGLDPHFGSGGVLALSPTVTAGTVTAVPDGGVAVGSWLPPSGGRRGVSVQLFDAAGQRSAVDVPFEVPVLSTGTMPLVAAAPDGTVYVGANTVHPPDASRAASTVDFALFRLRGGRLDPTFGTGGIASASFLLSWSPIAVEPLTDLPRALVIAADGAPVLVGVSRSTETTGRRTLTQGPGLGVVRFLR